MTTFLENPEKCIRRYVTCVSVGFLVVRRFPFDGESPGGVCKPWGDCVLWEHGDWSA